VNQHEQAKLTTACSNLHLHTHIKRLHPDRLLPTTQLLDPLTIPKFVNQLDQPPPVYIPTNVTDGSGKLIHQEYIVKVSEFTQQILPTATANGAPWVWTHEGLGI
jgi:hypothetical protein